MVCVLGIIPYWSYAQAGSNTDTLEAKTWHVFGRVSTVQGESLDGVTVRLQITSTAEDPRNMETNLQGEFHTELRFDDTASNRLQGNLVASKKGYLEGRETLDLGFEENNSGIHIVLRAPTEDPNQLSMTGLLSAIVPHLKDEASREFSDTSDREELVRGCEELMDSQNALAAVSVLTKIVERKPNCLECRSLLSLALLNTGSWSSAHEQLQKASKANESGILILPEPAVVMGVLEAWQMHLDEAAEWYQHALEADPNNTLALQELGRTFLAQKNWKMADQYLSKAFQTGSSNDVLLLRVRALLELGELEEAEREIDRYAAGRKIKDLPQEARTLYFAVENRLTLLLYGQVKSMTAQSPEELITNVPDLQGLKVAVNQRMLADVLEKTGEGVDAFFKRMPNTASLEQVHQERLAKDGKVKTSRDQEFQYMMEASTGQQDMGIKEYRSTANAPKSSMEGLKEGLMLTKGFASTSAIFHPSNRDGADFRYLGKQTLEGQEVHVIAFAQRPRTARIVTRFTTNKGSALILTHGLAWIDARSFQIIRLYTSLLHPVPDLRLRQFTTEIHYHQIEFDGGSTTLWLPQTVEIMVDWSGRILRNSHRYSDFKRFNVESKEERNPLAIPKSPPQKNL
jgi:tetratricopeptide (TPR) repeat protein